MEWGSRYITKGGSRSEYNEDASTNQKYVVDVTWVAVKRRLAGEHDKERRE